MACMKCGKDTEEGRTFCAHCLEVMDAYPIKPDVHIQLPVRDESVIPKKAPRKSRPSKDARIATLRLQNRLLWAVVVVLLLAIGILAGRGFLTV